MRRAIFMILVSNSTRGTISYICSAGPALADAGPNARPGHGAQCKT